MAERATVFLMLKAPERGRVKTRLGREIGAGAALRFYRHNSSLTIRRLRDNPRWQLVLAVAPESAVAGCWWPADMPLIRQGRGDLGARMERVLAQDAPGPSLIIGSDIPDITPVRIATALNRLRGADAVIGPAPDGGYWLIGLRRGAPLPRLFEGVRWSGPCARADTIANLRAHGLSIALADELCDVDDAASYRAMDAANLRLLPQRLS